ncbi:MAG: plastocyanin/azurin family copper-binding protein [Gemmatimonadales bacterium]
MGSSRRDFMRAGGLLLTGVGFAPTRQALASSLSEGVERLTGAIEIIQMRSDALGSRVWFDPIGLFVKAGTTIRWTVRENVHTTTAYHPRNDHRPLRIPTTAVPWDSGVLVNPGSVFEVTLTVAGVYDYCCAPHEAAGMVGRIVVGKALGPGAEPFDYWVGAAGTADWRHVPADARAAFPSVQSIIARRRVHVAA